MYTDENKTSALAAKLSAYDYVVLDTCSLMEDSFPMWLDTLSGGKKYWKEEGLQILVPEECLHELKKHIRDKSKKNIAKRIAAKRARKIVRHAKWHKVLTFLKKEKGPWAIADNAIYNFVNLHRLTERIMVITQDKNFAYDLLEQNHLGSQKGYPVQVFKIGRLGDLIFNKGERAELYGFRAVKDQPRGENGNLPNRKQTPKPETDPLLKGDIRIKANIDNPTYPLDRKIADINAQIKALDEAGSDKIASLHLYFDKKSLAERLAGLTAKKQPEPKDEAAKAEANKPTEQKPAEAKPEAPRETKPLKPKALASGKSLEEAVRGYCRAKSIIVRDDSVPYFAAVHGPFDITEKTVAEFLANVPGDKELDFTGDIGGLPIGLKTYGKFFDAYDPIMLIRSGVEKTAPKAEGTPKTPQNEPVAAQKDHKEVKIAVAKTPAEDAKPAGKPKAEKTVVIKKEDGTIEVKGTNRKDVQATPRAVVPKGATLIVGVPEGRKKNAIDRKARRIEAETAKKADGKAKSAPEAEPKPRSEAKEEPKTTAVKVKAKKPLSPELEEARKADMRLKANLNNPNYPKASAVKEIAAQIERLHKLSPYERSGLTYGLRELKNRETELGKEN